MAYTLPYPLCDSQLMTQVGFFDHLQDEHKLVYSGSNRQTLKPKLFALVVPIKRQKRKYECDETATDIQIDDAKILGNASESGTINPSLLSFKKPNTDPLCTIQNPPSPCVSIISAGTALASEDKIVDDEALFAVFTHQEDYGSLTNKIDHSECVNFAGFDKEVKDDRPPPVKRIRIVFKAKASRLIENMEEVEKAEMVRTRTKKSSSSKGKVTAASKKKRKTPNQNPISKSTTRTSKLCAGGVKASKISKTKSSSCFKLNCRG